MFILTALKAAASRNDLASLLKFTPSAMSYILYKQAPTDKYYVFNIPKRKGGQRTISAPSEALKLLQRNLADLLQDCVDEINVDKKRTERAVHGFARKRSIITNARQHRHRRWIFNLDLEEFFPSINFGRVRGYFIKNKDFQLAPAVATVIAQIACYNHSLPQGSPSSPVIANLVAHTLDMRLVKLANEVNCTYSRYADDLTFSTNKKDFPAEIARPLPGDNRHLWVPGDPLRSEIERSGFSINDRKSHVMYRSSRQEVTGLIVNQKIGVRHAYRHNVRAMVHKLVKTGAFDILGVVQKGDDVTLDKRPGTLDELHGMLGFIYSIDVYNKKNRAAEKKNRADEKKSRNSERAQLSGREDTYRRFLFYKTFFVSNSPVIVCEGETDNVYLTHAIRSLAGEFPDLAEQLPDNKVRLIPRLYKYPQSSTARLMGLRGGGSDIISKFIVAYVRELREFYGVRPTHPVIVLFDNDSGAKPIKGVIRGITKRQLADDAGFVHLVKNIYVVPTPGKNSKIEDFFADVDKNRTLDGKSFNDGDGFDPSLHYDKKIFAHRIVRPNADTIDFSGFRPLLANLAAAIQDYHTKILQPD